MPKYFLSREAIKQLQASEELTDREREVLILFYKRGWKIEDIAAKYDVSRRTMDRMLESIRGKKTS